MGKYFSQIENNIWNADELRIFDTIKEFSTKKKLTVLIIPL